MGWTEIGSTGSGGSVTSANYTIKPLTGVPSGTFQIKDGDGRTLTTIPLDARGKGTYIRQVKADNIGQQNLQVTYTGDHEFAGLTSDNFVSHIADANGNNSTTSQLRTVNKIVAGPGIYISPNDGYGTVAISTQPFNDPTVDDLYNVTWTITETTSSGILNTKFSDQSMFVAVGQKGCNIYSDDGITWSDMGAKNTQGVGDVSVSFNNVTVLQNSAIPDDGSAYYSVIRGVYAGTSDHYMGVVWGRLGYTNSSGVRIGDAIKYQSSKLQVGGIDQTGTITTSKCFYKNGLLSDALFLITDTTGNIYNCPQIPTDQIDIEVTSETPIQVYKELDAVTSDYFTGIESNLQDHTTSSYVACACTLAGEIWRSSRVGNSTSTWTQTYTSSGSLRDIAYGNGIWISVGARNLVVKCSTSTGVTWTAGNIYNAKSTQNWFSVAYGAGRWIAVGQYGALAYSEDDGVTWTRGDSGTKQDLYSITFSPKLNKFVAVGAKRTTVMIKGK
jgi:hypothetical protein